MAKQVNAVDVEIEELVIRAASGKYNLLPHLIELNIYENIFRSALTANLTLSDSHNIPAKLPIVGQETVDINIKFTGGSDGADEKFVNIKPPPMHVNSVPTRNYNKPKSQLFSLDMISEQYMSSVHSKVSRSYKDVAISDIVKDIYNTYIDDDNGMWIEETERDETCIIPNLRPYEAINWLARRAKQGDDYGVNYVFYETINGSFFVSLNYLASQIESGVTFVHKPAIDDPSGVIGVSLNEIKFNAFSFIKSFDKDDTIREGLYSSKLITHDIVRKRIHEWDYDGFLKWDVLTHVGEFPPLANSDIETKSASILRTSYAPPGDINSRAQDMKTMSGMVDSKVSFYPKHYGMYDSLNVIDKYDNDVENWKQQRDNNYGIYDGVSILIETTGNPNLQVGMLVKLLILSAETTDRDKMTDEIYDPFLSGKYMITAIQHIITISGSKDPRPVYNMRLELTKDGLESPVVIRASRKE